MRLLESHLAPRSSAALPAFAAFGAAAAIALALSHPWGIGSRRNLPAYVVDATGGQDSVRGAEPAASGKVVATADAPLTITLRPPTEVTGPLDVRVFAARGASVRDARATVRTSPWGAVEVHGAARDLVGGEAGETQLVVVIARQGAEVDPRAVAVGGTVPRGVAVGRVGVTVVP